MNTPRNRSADAPDLSEPEIARLVKLGAAEAHADMFHRVIGLGIREPVTPDVLADIHGLYQGLPAYAVQIGPESRPVYLSGWLESRDIPPCDNWVRV
jgi:hypothetical protein